MKSFTVEEKNAEVLLQKFKILILNESKIWKLIETDWLSQKNKYAEMRRDLFGRKDTCVHAIFWRFIGPQAEPVVAQQLELRRNQDVSTRSLITQVSTVHVKKILSKGKKGGNKNRAELRSRSKENTSVCFEILGMQVLTWTHSHPENLPKGRVEIRRGKGAWAHY